MALDEPFFPVVIKFPSQIVIDPPLRRPVSRREILTLGGLIFAALFWLAQPTEEIDGLFGRENDRAQKETYIQWRTWMGVYCQEQAARGYQGMSDDTRDSLKEKCSEMTQLPIIAAVTPDQAIFMLGAIKERSRKLNWGSME